MPVQLTQSANERSTYILTISFFDELGIAIIPTSIVWTLTDSDGNVMNSRSSVSIAVPAASVNIILSGDDLELTGADLRRIVYISAEYNSANGSGLPLREEFNFNILDLKNVS
jgi:hypothetical protein